MMKNFDCLPLLAALLYSATACCARPAVAGETLGTTPSVGMPVVREVWLGTSRHPSSEGIYHCRLNTKTGKLSPSRLVAKISGPGFLEQHPLKDVLYAVGTLDKTPVVAAYAIQGQGETAQLKLLDSHPIGDGGGTHLAVNAAGTMLITAQYGGGSVAVFALNDDGSIRARTQLIEHQGGSNVVARRQTSPHPHWCGFSPDNRFAFVPDLGLDKVMIYEVDAKNARLSEHGSAAVPPGGGPRHMKFHPTADCAYVLNELSLSVSVFKYDTVAGTLQRIQTVPAVPQAELDKELFKSASEIRVHPSGRFLYSANRGHDTITAYQVNTETGKLTVIEREHIRGATPRNFNLSPSGQWLLAAGQDSHTLASFSVNQETGELTYARSVIHTPAPICVLFGREK